MNKLFIKQNANTAPVIFRTAFEVVSSEINELEAKNMDESKFRILVVEDVLINQRVAKLSLESAGYEVDIAPTGQSALDLYQANSYAVILMDMGLPDLPGTEVTRQIRKLEQINAKKHTPIIALTANGSSAKQECLSAGMDDFSDKPFEIEVLNKTIRYWINHCGEQNKHKI